MRSQTFRVKYSLDQQICFMIRLRTDTVGYRVALTAALGGIGGYAFTLMNVPLPWLLGSLLVSTGCSIARMPVAMPGRLRTIFTAVLGVLLGSRITPEYFQDISKWGISIAALLMFVLVATSACYFYLTRIGGYSSANAFFGSVPGGLNDMTLIGAQMGADERVVALVHGCRLLLTVALMPVFLLVFAGAYVTPGAAAYESLAPLDALGIMLMVGSALTGSVVAGWLKLPGGALIGPLAVFGAVTFAGWTDAVPPGWLVAVAQIVSGTAIGVRFRNTPYDDLFRTMLVALGATLIQLNFSLLFAILVNLTSGLSIADLILAFAPGGQAEMSLLGLSLGGDIAFITLHSTIRANGAIIMAPIVFRRIMARSAALDGRR
jgi:membrane AbrB-like protein